MNEGSARQSVMLYLMERRIRIEEAAAIVKALEGDSALGAMRGRWEEPEDMLSYADRFALIVHVRHRVINWMNKYRENHPARCLFTGDS